MADFALAPRKAPKSPGVYILRMKNAEQFARIKGNTDILYIGSTSNLKSRFNGYNNPGKSQYTNLKVNNFVKNFKHEAEFMWKVEEGLESAKSSEHELLRRYLNEHHELPPLNGQDVRSLKITLPTEKLNIKVKESH